MSKLIGDQVSDLSVFSKKSTVKSTFLKSSREIPNFT